MRTAAPHRVARGPRAQCIHAPATTRSVLSALRAAPRQIAPLVTTWLFELAAVRYHVRHRFSRGRILRQATVFGLT